LRQRSFKKNRGKRRERERKRDTQNEEKKLIKMAVSPSLSHTISLRHFSFPVIQQSQAYLREKLTATREEKEGKGKVKYHPNMLAKDAYKFCNANITNFISVESPAASPEHDCGTHV
jgi:ribosomal protein L18